MRTVVLDADAVQAVIDRARALEAALTSACIAMEHAGNEHGDAALQDAAFAAYCTVHRLEPNVDDSGALTERLVHLVRGKR